MLTDNMVQVIETNFPTQEFTIKESEWVVPVLVRVSMAMIKCHDQKAPWGEKGFFGLHFHILVHH